MPRRLADLPSKPALDDRAFVPPPRFGAVAFASYVPGDPTQAEARRVVEAAAAAASDPEQRGRIAPREAWRAACARRRRAGGAGERARGLYLDGGFGVGKTHLLAAAYHAAPTRSKRYLSFQDLVHLIGVLGRDGSLALLGATRLLCLDEFELDDPGNTLIVKSFLAHVLERGTTVVTTSNTPPEAQGAGRFNAEDFAREIQSIALRFRVVRIEGPDARLGSVSGALARVDEVPPERPGVVRAGWGELLDHLARHHPSRYGAQLADLRGLVVTGVELLTDQNDAIRFVHFVDKAYDLRIPCWFVGDAGPDGLFDPAYAEGAFEKKYRRATSRLAEIAWEARSATAALSRAGD